MTQVSSSELEIDITELIDLKNNQDQDSGCIGSEVWIFHHVTDIANVVKIMKEHNLIFNLKLCSRCGLEALLDIKKWLWSCQSKFAVGKAKAKPCNSAFKGGWLESVLITRTA